MASTSSLTTVAYIYKTTYASDIGTVALRRHPLLSMITKTGGFTGTNFTYPIRYGNPQGVSADFPSAQTTAQGASAGMQFAAKRRKKYGVVVLDGESLQACDSKGSFLDLVTLETDSVITEVTDRLAFDLYRDATGVRGTRASASTNVITLTNADDARNFKINQYVVASPNAQGTSLRTGSTFVTAVSLSAGTITLNSAAGITSFADGDSLFSLGDAKGAGSDYVCIEGLEASTPLTAPTAGDSFRGQDRSVYVELLAGSRINDVNTNIEENLGLCAVNIDAAGGKADQAFINPVNFWKVARRLGAKVEYDGAGGTADYGFERIMVHTPAGTLKVYADPDCPTTRGRLFLGESHYIRTLEDLVHIVQDDGRPNLRSTSADSIEARVRSMGNYIQSDTRNHGVIAI